MNQMTELEASQASGLKCAYRKHKLPGESLKGFAHRQLTERSYDSLAREQATAWLNNKRCARTAKAAPLGLGSTRRKKGQGSKPGKSISGARPPSNAKNRNSIGLDQ